MTSRSDSSHPIFYLSVQTPIAYDLPTNFRAIGVGENAATAAGLTDDQGEPNIHNKNPLYCELTAYYWAWRHLLKNPGITGFGHHRRVFGTNSVLGLLAKQILNEQSIQLLERFDMIVPTPFTLRDSIMSAYKRVHQDDLLSIATRIIDEHHSLPQSAADFFNTSRTLYPFNMAIAKNKSWDTYFSWLFPVLEELEASCKSQSIQLKPRAIGFLGERLFSLWLHTSGLLRVEYPVLELDKSGLWNLKRYAALKIKRFVYDDGKVSSQ